MSEFAIEAENLSKRYLLGEDSTSLRIKQALHAIAPRLMNPNIEELWAVNDVSFKIRKGEAIGIIGGNGAGKSTLLKLLSRITPPTRGRAKIQGRVGTLLEVGTGFHPELTGRDNIALSGSILGMHPSEVAKKFDEIVDFSELDQFLDTPVKRYSSGMYCRLAFAVAAFLDPEILIVDEVLAVGDAGFQRKSLGRLNDASDREGRTVLFVSHNFEAIRTFCRRVIVLDHGKIIFDGDTQEGLEMYLRAQPKVVDVRGTALKNRLNRSTGDVRFTEFAATDARARLTWKFGAGDPLRLTLKYTAEKPVNDLTFLMTVYDAADSKCVTVIKEDISRSPLPQGHTGTIEIDIPRLPLRPGEYGLRLDLRSGDNRFGHDVLDSNVGVPFLVVSSDETNQYLRMGQVSIDYQVKLTAGQL